MATIDINLSTKNVEITPGLYGKVDVELEDIDVSDLLDAIDLDDVIEHHDKGKILEHIGKDEIINYFGIEEKED